MESLLIALLSATIGAVASTLVQRRHAGWLKQHDAAGMSYEAALQVERLMRTSIARARYVSDRLKAIPSEASPIMAEAAWHLNALTKSLRNAIERLSSATIKTRAVWGNDVASFFDRLLQESSALANALAALTEDIQGNTRPGSEFGEDESGYNWWNVLGQKEPDTKTLERDLQQLMSWIGAFARAAKVVVASAFSLPEAVREVVSEFEKHETQRRQCQLAPPKNPDQS